jgi:phenylalanyl-tRNA synthetase beta chain
MKVLESWLRSFVNPALTTSELAHKLTMSGAEVEGITAVAPPFTGVVVAQVKRVSKHPDADKLNVCEVDAGGVALQIVCGAPNVREGIKVPCAVVGALLPGDFAIKAAKLRGVDSQGMLCSARELGLSEDHGGLLILDETLKVGTSIREALALDDQVLELKLTPNKADCLSVFGMAREVSAITGAPLCTHTMKPVAATCNDKLTVKIEAPELCGRFSGRVVRNINCKAPTPDWMKQRLERVGQRSISAIVDISNYVMLELGRPTHMFDLDKIHGGLTVRWGKPGETLKLLNGSTVQLDETVGVISDERQVESLAGIMGGDATAVNDDTQHIYMEAAFWWPDAIRGRARKYNFSTDAAHRFERGVDASTTVDHLEYLTQLVLDICGTAQTTVGPMDDQITALPERKPVSMRAERCRKIIGANIATVEMGEIFKRLGLTHTLNGEVFTVTPPAYRFDMEIEEDLIEEVARIWGYENLPVRAPAARANMRTQAEALRPSHALRQQLAALGYNETMNFAFVDAQWEQDFAANDKAIKLLNPIASDLAVMRSSLIPSLVNNIATNLRHKQPRVRVFEIARTFHRDASALPGPLAVKGVHQPTRVAGAACGSLVDEQWGVKPSQAADYYDVKGDVEQLLSAAPQATLQFIKPKADELPAFHPGRSAHILLDGKHVGAIGEIHPRWQQKYALPIPVVAFELLLDALSAVTVPLYAGVPKQQPATRDLAFVLNDAVLHAELMSTLQSEAKANPSCSQVTDIVLFDVFKASAKQLSGMQLGEKSCAVRVSFASDEPMTDAQLDAATQALVSAAERSVLAKLRV